MRCDTSRFVIAACIAVTLPVLASPALARYAQVSAQDAGLVLEQGIGAVRLDALAGMRLAVPDENNELNLSDYGMNLTGRLQDADGRRMDLWYRSTDLVVDDRDASHVRSRTRNETIEAGTDLSWRKAGERLLGIRWSHDLFRYSYEMGDRGQTRGPSYGAYVVQKAGPVYLGAAITWATDAENLTTNDVFGITHDGEAWIYTGSVAYYRGPFDVGVQYDYDQTEIRGSGHDESRFHEDEYTWRRPDGRLSGSLVWHASEKLQGAVVGRLSSIDGREEVTISWSDRFPDNPSGANYKIRVGTFSEEVRTRTLGTRWEARPTEAINLAAEIENGSHDDKVDEGTNFKGTRREQDVEQSWNRIGVGVGWTSPMQRLRLAVEGAYTALSTDTRGIADVTTVDSFYAEARAGIEYFIRPAVALRGGYARLSEDANRDAGRSLLQGNAFTIGAGYLPKGGLIQVDAALRLEDMQPDYSDPSRESGRFHFSSSVRLLL